MPLPLKDDIVTALRAIDAQIKRVEEQAQQSEPNSHAKQLYTTQAESLRFARNTLNDGMNRMSDLQ